MLREIHLGGQLGKRYGRVHLLGVRTPAEAVRALDANFPGFAAYMLKLGEQGYGYRVLYGNGFRAGLESAEHLTNPVSGPIKFMPAIMGSKRNGIGQILAAVALVVAAIYAPAALITPLGEGGAIKVGNALMSAGIAMGIGGVINLLSPQPSAGDPKEKQSAPSYLFSGPVNTTAQGHPVPIGYGELIVGSAVISAGVDVVEEAIPVNPENKPTYTDPNTGEVVEYPAPTLVWDNNINNWRLPDMTQLLFDSRMVRKGGGSDGWYEEERYNFRTADGRVPYLNSNPVRWDIPNPTSFATFRKVGDEFFWRIGAIALIFNDAEKRWEIPRTEIFDGGA